MKKDHFSRQSDLYLQFRPGYPEALFAKIADAAPDTKLAVDLACGNGQAAVGLANYFEEVVGLDGSAGQIRVALARPNIRYSVASAEATGLADHCASVVTVAQALHWFDLEAFWPELKRILRLKGLFVAWSYALMEINPDIDRIWLHFYRETLRDTWPPDRAHVEEGYRNLGLPDWINRWPGFELVESWTREQFVGYVRTWSGVKRFQDRYGYDPSVPFDRDLASAWPDGEIRTVRWPLHVFWGRPNG